MSRKGVKSWLFLGTGLCNRQQICSVSMSRLLTPLTVTKAMEKCAGVFLRVSKGRQNQILGLEYHSCLLPRQHVSPFLLYFSFFGGAKSSEGQNLCCFNTLFFCGSAMKTVSYAVNRLSVLPSDCETGLPYIFSLLVLKVWSPDHE